MAEQTEIETVWDEFHTVVNMTSRELRDWLATASANEEAEALPDQVRPETGRRVLEILSKRRTDVTADDVEVMRHVVDVVRTVHPDPDGGDVDDDAWRRRLMNVGHDPLKAAR